MASLLEDGGGAMLGVASPGACRGGGDRPAATATSSCSTPTGWSNGAGESLTEGLARLAAPRPAEPARSPRSLCTRIVDSLLPAGDTRGDDVAILVARVADARIDTRAARARAADPTRQRLAGEAVRAGRRSRRSGWAEMVDTAELLVSELATNAMRHGRPPLVVRVRIVGNEVEVGVSDADPTVPVAARYRTLEESGRGLGLVAALSDGVGNAIAGAGQDGVVRTASRRRQDGRAVIVVWLLVALAIVFAVAAVVVGREARRLDAEPPRPVFDPDEAVEWVANHLPFEVSAVLSHDDVRQILDWNLQYFRSKGVSGNGSTPHLDAPDRGRRGRDGRLRAGPGVPDRQRLHPRAGPRRARCPDELPGGHRRGGAGGGRTTSNRSQNGERLRYHRRYQRKEVVRLSGESFGTLEVADH